MSSSRHTKHVVKAAACRLYTLAGQIVALLNGAAFANQPIDDRQEDRLVRQGQALIDKVEDLAERGEGH
jgi:hypothetical protein